jgi:transcriptional regulator with XRE-family HTH domain
MYNFYYGYSMETSTVGKRIKEKREEAGWTQTGLAKIAGITPSALSQIESGDRFPSTLVLHKLAKALSTSIDYLLDNKKEEDLSDLLRNKEIEVLFRTFKDLSKKDKDMILEHIKFLKSKKK